MGRGAGVSIPMPEPDASTNAAASAPPASSVDGKSPALGADASSPPDAAMVLPAAQFPVAPLAAGIAPLLPPTPPDAPAMLGLPVTDAAVEPAVPAAVPECPLAPVAPTGGAAADPLVHAPTKKAQITSEPRMSTEPWRAMNESIVSERRLPGTTNDCSQLTPQ